MDDDPEQLFGKLLLQALSRRLSQSSWLALAHQLTRRIQSFQQSRGEDVDPTLAGTLAASCLVQHILSQDFIDPLLIEYLQALVYGSATRSGVDPDQGPVTDVITVTLYLLAHVDDATTKVSAIETVSSVIGQGLLVTFQTNAPFKIADPALLVLLQRLFADKEVQDPSSSASVVSPPPSPESTRGSDVAPAALRFIVSNLRLLALAADASIAAPQNLLAPRAAITVLMNVGSSLLAHVIQRLSTLQASKDRPAADTPLLQQTRSECKAATADVETVLHSMNPAWKDEIALLRSLSSQIGVIHQLAHSLAGSSTSSTLQLRGKKAETMQDAQRRATWDHFLDAAATTAADKPPVEPEMALLMHLVVDERLAWSAKLDAIKTLFLARRVAAAPSVTLEKSLTAFYFELLVAAIDACASVVEMPPGFKGAEVYAAIWRNALCGMVPEIVLQLEQWLDVHPDLPLRGQRVEAPHVRFERALRAALLVMADRLDVCETAVSQPAVPNGATDATTGAEMDVVGLDTPPSQPIKAWLLRACIEHSLARPEAIADEFPEGHKLASEVQNLAQSLRMDAQLEGLALNTLFETRVPSDDPMELLQRVASDPGTHCSFARQLVVQVHAWLEQHDLESIARWCRALGDDATHGGAMLDTVMLYIDPTELVDPLAGILDHQDLGQTSDEPATLSNIILFVQLLCYRYSVPPSRISRFTSGASGEMEVDGTTGSAEAAGGQPFLASYLASASVCYPLSVLGEEERGLVGRWVHALFGNEGISDDLIQASPPTTLLRLAPLLFAQSIGACVHGVIDLETLRGGLSYFLQDLLSFTLPGALAWLLAEIVRVPLQPILDVLAEAGLQSSVVDVPSSDGTLANGLPRNANSRTVHLEVVALLLDTDACPAIVRHLIARPFDAFVQAMEAGGAATLEVGSETFNMASLKARMEAAGVTAQLLSRRNSAWLRALANQSVAQQHASVTTESETITMLCGPNAVSSTLDRLMGAQGRGLAAHSVAEQKALATWLCLLAPQANEVHPALRFVERVQLADEANLEAALRTIALVLSLARAAEAVRGHDTSTTSAADAILALATSTETNGARKDSCAADLFDDEPTTPPLPSVNAHAATDSQSNGASTGQSVAALLSSRAFRLTSAQVEDLLARKLVRLESSTPAIWHTVEAALLDPSELGNDKGKDSAPKEKIKTWIEMLRP